MQQAIPTLEHVQRLTRVTVCLRCPYRQPRTDQWNSDKPRSCEQACPIFVHLPLLREAARQLDPMASDRPKVLNRLVASILRGESHKARVLRKHGFRSAKQLLAMFPG